MKKKTNKTRDDKLTIGVFQKEYHLTSENGTEYVIKPLSVAKLGLLSRLLKKLEDLGELESFMITFWISVTDNSVFVNLLRNDEDIELSFYEFMDGLTANDIEKIGKVISETEDVVTSALVQIEEDETDSEKK